MKTENETNQIINDAAESMINKYEGDKNAYIYTQFLNVHKKLIRFLSPEKKATLIDGSPEDSAQVFSEFLVKNNGISSLNKPLGFFINSIGPKTNENEESIADKVEKMIPEIILKGQKEKQEREEEEERLENERKRKETATKEQEQTEKRKITTKIFQKEEKTQEIENKLSTKQIDLLGEILVNQKRANLSKDYDFFMGDSEEFKTLTSLVENLNNNEIDSVLTLIKDKNPEYYKNLEFKSKGHNKNPEDISSLINEKNNHIKNESKNSRTLLLEEVNNHSLKNKSFIDEMEMPNIGEIKSHIEKNNKNTKEFDKINNHNSTKRPK